MWRPLRAPLFFPRAASNRTSQQPPGQQQAATDEQSRKDADEKAWTEAVSAGTAAAFNGYIQNFASGAHVAEARERVAALNEQARKQADEKAWADAQRAGTVSAFNGYIQNFASGAHVAEARQRITALNEQARKDAWTRRPGPMPCAPVPRRRSIPICRTTAPARMSAEARAAHRCAR